MRPLATLDSGLRQRIRGVLTDIDDTLTTDGRLTGAAYAALERLHEAGLLVIPITGRPAGWCDHIARMWPVDGVVGENGAFYFRYDPGARRMIRRFTLSEAERREGRARLEALGQDILKAVPGAGIAADQLYREADLAIDFCEDVPPLPLGEVDRIVELARAAGATAKVSSIHVNIWFGVWDKLSMTEVMLREVFDTELDAARDRFAFIGDSPNDAPMFGYFPVSVGVANVRDFEGRLPAAPAYVTKARGGAGFAEFAEALLAS